MNCIIVILGVSQEDYLAIREDLQAQLKALEVTPPPLFARLPADYTGIDIVWIEEPSRVETVYSRSDKAIEDFVKMQMMATA